MGQGNVDISRARRHSQRNIAKLAAYLSKYLSKTFDAGGVGDSYRASGKALPKPVVVRSLATDLEGAGSDLLGLLFKFYSVRTFHSAYLDCGGVYVAITPRGYRGVAPDGDDGLEQSSPGIPASMVSFACSAVCSCAAVFRA